ncbi:MAG: tyrosine recombinase XerC [Clostridia bacterium]|nr:tyrosine recombinase XerC [Clostridia bacterium]
MSKYTQEIRTTAPVIRDFLNYMLVVKGKSQLTVDEYYKDLRTFFRYIKVSRGLADENELSTIGIADVTLELIASVSLSDAFEFMNYCIDERDNHAATRARKACSLRVFYRYLTNKVHLLDTNPLQELDTPKIGKSLPKYLTLEEAIRLLQSVDGSNRERDYCILTLFLNCGMRLSELCGINLSDVRDDNTLRLVGKGNKERIVYLNEACIAAIHVYLRVRPVDGVKDKNALFLSRMKKRISPRMVEEIVYKYLDKAGLGGRGLSVHKLRHTAATLMYQHGQVDVRVLKDILGHENLGTTEIYTHLSNKQLEDAAKSNPLSQIQEIE